MFCDLVGSTALAARLDPEDMREILRSSQKCCADIISKYEGFVAQYLGDGIMAYFGYPQAHEDDVERAVQAGLDLVAAVARLEGKVRIEFHVGIATGLVVVGDLIGEGFARQEAVVGETPNLAARLQELAPRGGVLIAEATRRLLGDLFEFEVLGARALKGFDAAIPVYQVKGEGHVESRFEALHAGALAPLVGREQELALLLERWSKAKTDHGQVVLLSGEAGIGKSRLTTALLERLAVEPILGCAISAPLSTRTARSIRSSARWNVPPRWRAMMRWERSSTSWTSGSGRPRPLCRTPRSLPRC